MEKLQLMKKEIKETLANNEYKIPKINGVDNLSVSDLECALDRIKYLETGNFYRLMPVASNVKKLFESYGINPEQNNIYKYL